jgi:Rrf2 family transcriptional regulator, nitric oxide-sensitive transcriptional repressor
MRLTLYTDYALRLLMYLGLARDRLVTIQEVADAYGISKNHLMKLVNELQQAGYVDTVRGRGGGMRLAREPETIRLDELVRTTEEDFRVVECFDPVTNRCRISGACRLQGVLREALEAWFAVLASYTLADLLCSPALPFGLGLPEPAAPSLPAPI